MTPAEWATCCSTFVDKYSRGQWGEDIRRNGCLGWTWKPHPTWPAFGYMTRQVTLRYRNSTTEPLVESELPEEPDLEGAVDWNQVSHTRSRRELNSTQYVVYSPSFQVPAFYFVVSDGDGRVLSIEETVKTTIFRPGVVPEAAVHTTHIDRPGEQAEDASVFPLLSQGDHPVLQTPCLYVHPCETQTAVKELVHARQSETGDTMGHEQWLEMWFLVLGGVLDLGE
ncbi:hypothetical protein PIIN_01044 [Serendipita indica DSM 11827]|uniref:Ubiquitin-like-conjugating enzyme ATG10 n=1 Tax=Serendipita indica (strain DSM 11827) TaxID=1109443 RepID=G4T7F3_SERID|nr:hypothetical protein PIIN_01044 [Serendipita indica DSM 11827]